MTWTRVNAVTTFVLSILVSGVCVADDLRTEYGGHLKGRYTFQSFPDDSIFNDVTGSTAHDGIAELRLKLNLEKGPWRFDGAYQMFALYGDQVEYSRDLPPAFAFFSGRLPDDRRRLFDLTDVIVDKNKTVVVQRLDRISVGYTGEKAVLRFGRQTISWGNGMFFAPMDIVNPFDPAAVDTEYKIGDDMLLGQYLFDSGDDAQAAVVFRRDLITGDVDKDSSTAAFKYHGGAGQGEYDVLLAQNYSDPMVALGGNVSLGGAVVRGDLVVSDTSTEDVIASFVANYSYSWVMGGKNTSGAIEYFFNGYGQRKGDYSDLGENEELLKRIARGELFTLGRHYIAGSLMIEMTPLWQLTPNVFTNLSDGSALAQVVTQHSVSDNITLLGALNVPLGPSGTEYGGLPAGVPDKYLSYDLSAFLQFAWYF